MRHLGRQHAVARLGKGLITISGIWAAPTPATPSSSHQTDPTLSCFVSSATFPVRATPPKPTTKPNTGQATPNAALTVAGRVARTYLPLDRRCRR
jgi:hypothetical protein